jgi:hypothetical protein
MPKGPTGYHSQYVNRRFVLQAHRCLGNCGCSEVGCTQHWAWKNGVPPPKNIGDNGWDYSCVDYQLYYYGAYQGPVPGKTKQERFLGDYDNIMQLVKPLDGITIFCNWDRELVADIFEKVKEVFAGYTVPTTKALYFFIPDLFIILDREQVWKPWKRECAGTSILPRLIDDVDGRAYVALLNYVRSKISSSIKSGMAFSLDNKRAVMVKNVDQLRLVTPLQLSVPQSVGHTFGKVIDNLIH